MYFYLFLFFSHILHLNQFPLPPLLPKLPVPLNPRPTPLLVPLKNEHLPSGIYRTWHGKLYYAYHMRDEKGNLVGRKVSEGQQEKESEMSIFSWISFPFWYL